MFEHIVKCKNNSYNNMKFKQVSEMCKEEYPNFYAKFMEELQE